jgi:hypothetical protein
MDRPIGSTPVQIDLGQTSAPPSRPPGQGFRRDRWGAVHPVYRRPSLDRYSIAGYSAGRACTSTSHSRLRSARPPALSGAASSLPTTRARPPSGCTTSTSSNWPGVKQYGRKGGMGQACAPGVAAVTAQLRKASSLHERQRRRHRNVRRPDPARHGDRLLRRHSSPAAAARQRAAAPPAAPRVGLGPHCRLLVSPHLVSRTGEGDKPWFGRVRRSGHDCFPLSSTARASRSMAAPTASSACTWAA